MSLTEDWLKLIHPDYLRREFFDIKPGLSIIREVLSCLGVKKEKPIIQIVGTNGKGSTTYAISRLLQIEGYSVGTFVSPHEISPSERILINDRQIDSAQLKDVVSIVNVIEKSAGISLSYFELLTVAALYWFKICNVDIIVLEAGMGGRWDATSALGQDVLAVTTIGIDHTDYLGETTKEIAKEKIAAASKRSKIVIAPQRPEVREVLADYLKNGFSFKYIDKESIKILESSLSGTKFLYNDMPIETDLAGGFQAVNIAAAIESVRALNSRYDISNVRLNLRIPSRLQVKKIDNRTMVFDGAHNRDAMKAVCGFFEKLKKKTTVIYSSMKDKNYPENLQLLSKIANSIFIVGLPFERAEKAINLFKASEGLFNHREIISDNRIASGLKKVTGFNETILVTGSFYLTGFIKYALEAESKKV